MDIREFYKGKNIFITGGTGYVGKAVAEKLLRSCGVGKIFLLIRPKPKMTVAQRLDRIKSNMIFDILKEEKPNEIDKLTAIAGDITQDGLGLNQDDKQLLIDSIQVILHSAASVEMAGDMKEIIEANLCGTRRVLNFAASCLNCQVFLYISTSFVHPKSQGKSTIRREVPVPVTYDEEELMMTITRLNKNERNRVGPLLLGNFGNWYTASKGYAEWALRETKKFPRVIIRPSSISSAWKEPFAGFHDSHNSVPNVVRGAYTGIIRRTAVERTIDSIPIDIVVNLIIASGWKAAMENSDTPFIYHATSGPYLPTNSYAKTINSFIHDYPSKHAVWYPNLRFRSSFNTLNFSLFFYQLIPGLCFDLLLLLIGKRPMFFTILKRFRELNENIQLFGSKKYDFSIDNLLGLYKELSKEEREIFSMNLPDINWEKYYRDMTSGVRRCLLRESHRDLKAARRKNQILRVLNFCVECAFHGSLWWLASIGSGFPLVWLVWVPVLSYCIFTFVL